MNTEMRIAKTDVYAVGGLDLTPAPFKRNLGSAIVEIAINDYRNPDPQAHEQAQAFLFPQTEAARNHFAWVLALAPGVNPQWLREMLDGRRSKWDAQRARLRKRAQ